MAAPFHRHQADGGGAVRPLPFFAYWRSQRRQFFSFRATVLAWTAQEARRGFRIPRGAPEPRVVGVKLCAAASGLPGGCQTALGGRWVG